MKNERLVRFSIPLKTIFDFQGEDMYEETLEDHFRLIVCDELLRNHVSFQFDYNAFKVKDGFGIELKYQGPDIDLIIVIQKLFKHKFRLGLIVQKFDKGKWIEVYNDSRRAKYKEFETTN